MQRILFVDDERRILEGIENLLIDCDDWDLAFATGGEEALRILERDPHFDVVVTDMRMPGMDGLQLLERVLIAYPHTMRVVLSGDAELEVAMQAITIAHHYLSKPCDEPTLVSALERVLAIRRIVTDDELRRYLGSVPEVPRDDDVLDRVLHVAQGSGDVAELASIVASSCGLTTKIVQAASSPLFGGAPVTTLAGAIQRIGCSGAAALARALQSYGCASIGDESRHREHQQHQTQIAMVAAALTTDPQESERAYLCGLLHDIGTLTLLAHVPQRLEQCREQWNANTGGLVEIEQRVLGIDHAALGAAILDLIGMQGVAQVIRYHHAPSRAGGPARLDALGALHIADAVHATFDGGALELDDDFMTALGPIAEVALFRAGKLVTS